MAAEKFVTEWGVASPWGTSAVEDYRSAETIVRNMKEAGHKATVVWRAVSPWQKQE